MSAILKILFITFAISVSNVFVIYWWFFTKQITISPLFGESPTIVKLAFTLLILLISIICNKTLDKLGSTIDGSYRQQAARILAVVSLVLSLIYCILLARLLLPFIDILSQVPSSDIPLYLITLVLCSTIINTLIKIAGFIPTMLGSIIDVIGFFKKSKNSKANSKECFGSGLCFASPSAHEIMTQDKRPPVLYLRSFQKELLDTTIMGRFAYLRNIRDRGTYMEPGTTSGLYNLMKNNLRVISAGTNRSFFDEQCVFSSFFSLIGPYITIGRPGESHRDMHIGSVKMFVSNEKWQSTVLDLLNRSCVIVLESGDSEGLLWEIRQIIAHVPAKKLIIILPRTNKEYKIFLSFTKDAFPKPLPEQRARSRLIIFEDDWTPIELTNVDFTVASALKPFYQRNSANLKNLAELYDTQNQCAKAEPLYQWALAIQEKAFGSDHPYVEASLNGLARLYYTQGQYGKAETLYQRVLSIREKAFGPDHPDVASVLNSLGVIYLKQDEFVKAELVFQQALTIMEKAIKPDEVDLLGILINNLAELYCRQGQYGKAEPLFLRSLTITEKVIGPNNPIVAVTLTHMADLYNAQSDYSKAEPLYQRALAIREKSIGPNHPDVVAILNNLAALYRAQGKIVKAEAMEARAKAISAY